MNREDTIVAIANLSHEKFRRLYDEVNNGTRIKKTIDNEWIMKYGTDQADLAKLSYSELPRDWKKERWSGAKTAFDAIHKQISFGEKIDRKFIEYVSDLVHKDWLERNNHTAEQEHRLSYTELSEEVKEKDRIFVRSALEIYDK